MKACYSFKYPYIASMKKQEYLNKFSQINDTFGYWSAEMLDLNNKCIDIKGYDTYCKWHDEAKLNNELK